VIAIIYNIQLAVVASNDLPTAIEAFEWAEQYLGWNNLKRLKTKVDGRYIKILTTEY
jgi:hypothetical protein